LLHALHHPCDSIEGLEDLDTTELEYKLWLIIPNEFTIEDIGEIILHELDEDGLKEFECVTVKDFPKEIAAHGASSAMDDGIAMHPMSEALEASVAHICTS
jgi:hypothetical protein